MKKLFLLLGLLCLPTLGFAKYCPTCFQTFQVQTTRGKSKLFYHWLVIALNPNNPIKYKNFQTLFDKNITITSNGNRVAQGLPAAYRYLIRKRQQWPLLASSLKTMLVDGQQAAIEYQMITQHRGQKYRFLIITILEFKRHKVFDWTSVSYITKIED